MPKISSVSYPLRSSNPADNRRTSGWTSGFAVTPPTVPDLTANATAARAPRDSFLALREGNEEADAGRPLGARVTHEP